MGYNVNQAVIKDTPFHLTSDEEEAAFSALVLKHLLVRVQPAIFHSATLAENKLDVPRFPKVTKRHSLAVVRNTFE